MRSNAAEWRPDLVIRLFGDDHRGGAFGKVISSSECAAWACWLMARASVGMAFRGDRERRKRQGRSRAPPSESGGVQQFCSAVFRFTCRAVVHRLRCTVGVRALGIRDRHVDMAATLMVDCIMNGGRCALAGREGCSTSRRGSSWRRLRKVGVPLIMLPFLAFLVGSRATWRPALVL